ncbi:MAG: hypothetical protein H8K09_07020 [Nitrospira sp.]|nr:hypothetical protein [Nitrospira sp.]
MTNVPSNQFLLIGLPSAGKTSFLAALWYMVNQSDIKCALKLERLEGDSSYLNLIRDAWLEYQSVPRTRLESQIEVSMLLEDQQTQKILRLTFPDLSGESFTSQWATRQVTTKYDALLRHSNGCILFIHPDNVLKPHRTDSLNALTEIIEGIQGASEVSEPDLAQSLVKPWDVEKAPTQVQLVELLQIIAGRDYFSPPFRLAVVISAWDLIGATSKSPDDWISSELPLLNQYLTSNRTSFEVAYYGLSAQGGRYAAVQFLPTDFKSPQDLVEILSKGGDKLSAWLWGRIGDAAQALLQDKTSDPNQVSSRLAKRFNEIISQAGMYEEERFAKFHLRGETKDLLANRHYQSEKDVLRLNRCLLEDAYPLNISREKQYDQAILDLHQKHPARRTFLNGRHVINPHDITEPLQWLMH